MCENFLHGCIKVRAPLHLQSHSNHFDQVFCNCHPLKVEMNEIYLLDRWYSGKKCTFRTPALFNNNNFNEIVMKILLTISNYFSPFYIVRIEKRKTKNRKEENKKGKKARRNVQKIVEILNSTRKKVIRTLLVFEWCTRNWRILSYLATFFSRRNETKDWKSHLEGKNSDHFYRIRVN